jgi:hypothetical protein
MTHRPVLCAAAQARWATGRRSSCAARVLAGRLHINVSSAYAVELANTNETLKHTLKF